MSFEMPWRIRIATCFLRGFLRHPRKALRYGRDITVDMKSLYRFNLHIHGERFLRDFLDESEKLGIKPFLLWGSLLGCIREGKILDHDYDLDTGILEIDYAKKNKLIKGMLARGYLLRFDLPYNFSFQLKDKLLHLDVDLLYESSGYLITSMASEKTGEVLVHRFPNEAFLELKKRRLGGIPDVWVPGDPEAVLEWSYGNWRVPTKKYNYETDLLCKVQDPASMGIDVTRISFVPF